MSSQPHLFNYNQPSNSSIGVGSNMQQPSRSVNSLQFPGRLGHTSHLSGHNTPTTSGIHFSPSGVLNLHPQQTSPNSFHTADDFTKRDSRHVMFNVGGSSFATGMPNYGLSHNSRSFAGQTMLNNTMPNSTFASSPALDLSEFPSLTNRNPQESSAASVLQNPMAGRPPYVGMVKQPATESSEFHIHSEDFPALPGSQNNTSHDTMNKPGSSKGADSTDHFSNKTSSRSQKYGTQVSKDGFVANIPPGMISDQYGMLGLLTFIHTADTDPELASLTLGTDLTTLGLNLNNTGNLYPTFGGPWAEQPCKPQDIDYNVPSEYLINQNIRDKLAPVKLNRYGDDLLFFIFYMYGGDVMQVAAAVELFNRDWRFHKDEKVWITRVPGMVPTEKTATYERGMYYFFDPENWRKIPKEFHLDYDRLEERATTPSTASV